MHFGPYAFSLYAPTVGGAAHAPNAQQAKPTTWVQNELEIHCSKRDHVASIISLMGLPAPALATL